MSKNPTAPPNIIGRARGGGRFKGPIVHAKDKKGTLKRIWQYMEKQKGAIICSVIFVIISTISGLIAPYLIGITIDDYIIPQDLNGTLKYLILLAAVYLLTSIFTWLQNLFMVRVSLQTIRNLRRDLFQKFHTLSLRFFDKHAHGDLMSRVTNDIESLNQALSQSVIQIISSFLMVSGVAISMFILNWFLAIVSLIIVPLIIYTTKIIIKHSSRNFIKRQYDLGELNGYIEETISGNEVITLFSQENKTFTEFNDINERLRKSATAADLISGLLGPINNFINNLGLALIIGVGAIMTVKGLATVGIIAAFVTYSRQFFRPINQLSNLLNTFQSAIAGAERVFEVMDEPEDIHDKQNAKPVESFKGHVTFSHVHFSYEQNKPVLKDITFQAKPGQKIALVGPTGSGKTTIINLLMRFYDIQSGYIDIDGENIQNYKINQLRERIGIVLQDTVLFSGTIMDNIRYGRLDATDTEVITAAKMASAHRFIKHLPQQYDTKVISGGSSLSQGQRQLLAIARAILADSDILILDEATSSIDTKTEIEIQRGLDQLSKGRTSFVIAHRLKTIERADQILVIYHGELIEAGTHEELLAEKGFYWKLHNSQSYIYE